MPITEALLQAFANAPPEPQELTRQRCDAAQILRTRGLPTRHDEGWKYTSLHALDPLALVMGASSRRVSSEDLDTLGAIDASDCIRLVFVDGRFDATLSRLGTLPEQLRLRVWSSSRSATEASEVLAAAAPDDAFDAINRMFANCGLDIELGAGARVETPLLVLVVQTNAGAIHLRHRLALGVGARLCMIEQHLALPDTSAYFATHIARVTLAARAELTHVRLQTEGESAAHMSQLHVIQGKDSRLSAQALVIGAALSRQEWHVNHCASGCATDARAAMLLHGQQHADMHLRIVHREPHGKSRTHLRGVFDDAAHGVFTGRVDVLPGASKTDAAMINRNLLLSPTAEIDTRPQLQIDTDDVLCSHGAVVGQLDADALFYLVSRGIDPQQAQEMLVQAFIQQALPDFGWPPLSTQVDKLLPKHGMFTLSGAWDAT